jgi:hypothetical protein
VLTADRNLLAIGAIDEDSASEGINKELYIYFNL